MTAPLLTPAEAAAHFRVCRNTLAVMRDRGLVRAVNLNPGGKRAVWRYHPGLGAGEEIDTDLKYLDLKRRIGL